jgi:hypothetical protein
MIALLVDDWLWPRCRFAVEESVHDRLQVEQIGERRDTTLAAFIARGEGAIGLVGASNSSIVPERGCGCHLEAQ